MNRAQQLGIGSCWGVALAVLCAAGVSACHASGAPNGLPQAASGAPPLAVSEVSLERRCFGCPAPYSVTLRRDGEATRIVYGSARQGTEDRRFAGKVARGQFDALAALLLGEGFFELDESYRDAATADGEWLVTSAVRDGSRKSVLNANRAGPEGLARVERAIDETAARITWTESPQR